MMTVIEKIGLLDSLPSISLADLQAEAAFLTRRDRKYLVPIETAGALMSGIDPATRVLEIHGRRSFGYVTPYFDDRDHSSYLGAARRRPNRFKVRTRLYTDSGVCQLEVKVRDARGRTVKHRMEHDVRSIADLSDAERGWLSSFPQVAPYANRIQHCITTQYQRITLVLPDGAGRVTIDRDLIFALPDGKARAVPHFVIIETKGAGGPTSLDRLLWRNGHRPAAMSKFASGLSLLIPELPANRWHRIRNQLAASSNEEYRESTATLCHSTPAPGNDRGRAGAGCDGSRMMSQLEVIPWTPITAQSVEKVGGLVFTGA